MNKLDVQNAILNAMTPYLDDDQLYQLKNTLEETRLSVGKRTKICVKKNENLCQKFCAATAGKITLFLQKCKITTRKCKPKKGHYISFFAMIVLQTRRINPLLL